MFVTRLSALVAISLAKCFTFLSVHDTFCCSISGTYVRSNARNSHLSYVFIRHRRQVNLDIRLGQSDREQVPWIVAAHLPSYLLPNRLSQRKHALPISLSQSQRIPSPRWRKGSLVPDSFPNRQCNSITTADVVDSIIPAIPLI
ncbi:hypothetical protein BDZ97DRAFT_1434618 [Flammula alnicola]|nr:hypothetical protein BDZ97DRAFT_1434618 [Flammula alnicola]